MKSALIGRQLGDYTLVRVLATGGMSRIYEGLDKRLNRRAAIKVLDLEADPNDTDSLRLRFEREARALAKLEHPNIVPIYQFGDIDGLYFIAMKLIEGGDLADELKELRRLDQTMPPARAIALLEQLADAIDTAHAARIIHRDIKPSNILIDLNDRVILTDFGLVIEPSLDSTFGTAFGTPRYISPEQATDSSQAVPQSDIYSLGIVVYEMLTGRTPFDGRSPMEIAISHVQEPPPAPRTLNPAIPPAVEAALLRALAKTPNERFSSASAFIDALRAGYRDAGLLPDDTTSLGRTTALPGLAAALPAQPATPPRRPTPWLLIAGIAAAGLVALFALIWVVALPQGTETVGRVQTQAVMEAQNTATALALLFVAPTDAATAEAVAVVETQPPTATPPSPTPTLTPIPRTLDGLALVYDTSALTLINLRAAPLPLAGVTFTRAGQVLFDGSRVPGGALPARACYRVRAQDRRVELPRECTGGLHGELAPRDAAALFWLTEGFIVSAAGEGERACPPAREASGCAPGG
jgi:predicted Ser/Thr protein kinase